MTHLAFAFSGLIVGLLVGLTGVGAGSLMTPLLILLFAVHPARAVGSDLLYAATTKVFAAGIHGFRGSVDWRVTGLLATGSVPATILTILFAASTHWKNGHTGALITSVLAIVLLVTALLLIFQSQVVRLGARFMGEPRPRRTMALTILTGVIVGILVTLTSIGAGAIGVTALFVLYPRLPASRLIASDIVHAVPLTLIAGAGHWWLGDVDFGLVGSLLVGSIPGVILGSLLSVRMPDRALRLCLAAILTIVGIRLLM
ncbi:sulfite exporter TauE/SafE family protein [Acidisoma cladoniae]|jgi:uncharacterized membrane protein YfcA|uniref:sulfite exporter TauE/SafE family protein n=1 Tax=Acidisoma cladoniae TaxID=3040935 RepID=UPI0025519970|nr:sulfite exporter TauE/SafE family protein [Acidisoma sp. PAMC 29798]